MTIAILHPRFDTMGGAEYFALAFADALLDAGQAVTLVTGIPPAAPRRYPVLVTPFTMRMGSWPRTLRLLRETLPAFDLVNYHNYPAGLLAELALRRAKTRPRTAWMCQEPYHSLYGKKPADADELRRRHRFDPQYRLTTRVDRKMVARAGVVFGNSPRTAAFGEHVYGRPFQVLYPFTTPRASYRDEALESRKDNVLFGIGRLHRGLKNVEGTLAAFALVRARRPEFRLAWAGRGPDEDFFRAEAARLGVADAVDFLGFVDDAARDAWFARAALVVNVPHDEPFGLGAVEPAPFGTPVVNSATSGSAALIADGETGYLCDPADPRAIAERILAALDDPAGRRRVAANAFREGREKWTVEAAAERFLAVVTAGS